MHPHNKGERKRIRYFKGIRRVNERVSGHTCSKYCYEHPGGCNVIDSDKDWVCFTSWWCERHAKGGRGKRFAQLADYPQVCSCMGCGNPRRAYDGYPTVGERKSGERDDTNVNSVRFARLYDQLVDE